MPFEDSGVIGIELKNFALDGGVDRPVVRGPRAVRWQARVSERERVKS